MSPNGQPTTHPPQRLAALKQLPRPVYGHAHALPNIALGYAHCHPWAQLSHAISGVLEVRTEQALYVVPPHRAVWIPANTVHRVTCTTGTCIRSLYVDLTANCRRSTDCRVLSVNPLLRELISTFSGLPVDYEQYGADGRLVQVLLDQLAVAPEEDMRLPLPSDERLGGLCRRLQEQPEDTTGLADWALQLGVSEKTLSRVFRRETGLTFRAWRQRLRMLSALPALERGERVTDVALACGYESLSAFIAAFGQQFGRSPGEWLRGDTKAAP
uniref:AraC family transcriptional regulator n=1 Tax=Pseudomonas laurentiana TaxID=2364649 RepID=UPI0029C7BC3C|nr:helix-turn-helix transcriptional regulator [Pseudomonas laurentiana]